MTTFEEFNEHVARLTQAKHLGKDDLIANFALGLAGETGETIDLLKKTLFHGTELNREKLVSELGDVLWYWVALCQQLHVSPIEIFAEYDRFEGCSTLSPKAVSRSAMKLAIDSGRAVDSVDRYLFSGKGISATALILTLGNVLNRWLTLCEQANISPQEIMAYNIQKLEKRHEGRVFSREAAMRNKAKEAQ